MSMQSVTALLVVHDGATWLPEVVASVASQSRKADRIVAVDTGSVDASAKLLKGARIAAHQLDRETGFGEALAYAVAQLPASISGKEEWLWILHDDCAFDPLALESLLNAVADRPQVAMAGPKLLGWHDRTHLLEVGISLATNGARWTGLEHSEYDQGQRDGIHEVLAVSTAGALIRRDIFEELGGFDKNLELFRDDVDFGWRVRVAGHSVLAVTDAIGYHAQASANERRSVDVKGALLHRPLLLDRRNAAYVLLANSSIWALPLLAIQLIAGALTRSIGYLFAKLPGYASDEILAILSLIIQPNELLAARRDRKKKRLISSRVIAPFIPSRFAQVRSATSHSLDTLREKLLPEKKAVEDYSVLEINEDEDLLVPAAQRSWKSFFTQPLVATASIIGLVTLFWSRYRFGDISGGALPVSPESWSDLFKLYIASWHDIAMGSGLSTPPWVLVVATASILTFGNVSALISLFFLAAPLALLFSAHRYLATFTANRWLSAGAAALYALSPVAIAAINAGRLGVVVLLLLLPFAASYAASWRDIQSWSWRRIFGLCLFIWLLYIFNPSFLLVMILITSFSIVQDFLSAGRNYRDLVFIQRLIRRASTVLLPILLSAPGSFAIFFNPSVLVSEIGFTIPGGGPNLALFANPGGPGSLPWWSISPVSLILLVTYFSTTAARKFASPGIAALLVGSLISSLVISGNGSTYTTRVFAGVFISIATLLAIVAAVVMFDKIRSRLEQSHINYRHLSVALVLFMSLSYSLSAAFWLTTSGADSPNRIHSEQVLPAYLAIEEDAKTVIISPYRQKGELTLSYYISRGREITLGEPDVAPTDNPVISRAIEGLIDNTGVTSSKVLSNYGIKYVFLKNPASQEVIQTIDGLGGFNRTSATDSGIVWRVLAETGRLKFTDYAGKVQILESKGVRSFVPGPGTLTLAETYSSAWQVYQDGYRLAKIANENGLPTFEVATGGAISIIHNGTVRRAWISFFTIVLVTVVVLALPAGRRRSEISERELA
jgi:GT2 family glycosyltransferase